MSRPLLRASILYHDKGRIFDGKNILATFLTYDETKNSQRGTHIYAPWLSDFSLVWDSHWDAHRGEYV